MTIQDILNLYTVNDPVYGRKLKVTGDAADLTGILTNNDTYGRRVKVDFSSQDIDILKNNEYKVTYFAEINTDSGTIVIPTGATILENQYPGGVDALVSTLSVGVPTGQNPITAGGNVVDVFSFDTLGNYVLTDTPSSFPVALIYTLKIKAIDWQNLDINHILDWSVSSNFRLFNDPDPTLSAALNANGFPIDDFLYITGRSGSPTALRTNGGIGDTVALQAFDVDGGFYTTFATLTAANTPTFNLEDTVTKSGQYIYRVAGTDVSLADGGTGASLTNPNFNALMGWDDTDNAVTFIALGSGLTYDHATHTLSASGGGGSSLIVGTTGVTNGTIGRILYEGAGNILQEDSNLFWDAANTRLRIPILSSVGNTSLQFQTNGTYRIGIGNDGQFNYNESIGAVNTSVIFKAVSGYASIARFYTSSGLNAHDFRDNSYIFSNIGIFGNDNGYPMIYGAGGENFTFGIGANNCINIGRLYGTAGAGVASNRGQIAFINQGGTYAGGTKDTTIWYSNVSGGAVATVDIEGKASFRGSQERIVSKNSNYTVTLNDFTLVGMAASGVINFTLPTAAAAYDSVLETGSIFNFYKGDSSVNVVNIKNSGGTTLYTLSLQGDKKSLQSDGTNWIDYIN